MVLAAVPAFPCGGPGADIVDRPLVPVHDYLLHTLYDDEYESRLRPELRERAKIEAHLRSTTELYYSLGAYARWLDGATRSTPGLVAVVREADQVYNRLVNWDETNSRFWSAALTKSPEARSIRRAGSLLPKRR